MCTEPGTVPPLNPSLEATASLWIEPGACWKALRGVRYSPARSARAASDIVSSRFLIVEPPGGRLEGAHHRLEIAAVEELALGLGDLGEGPLEPADRVVGP